MAADGQQDYVVAAPRAKLQKKATLVLEDGTRFNGYSFGAPVSVVGETVFQTGMVGYPESLTDPSYTRQLLCLTFPMIGNYGVPDRQVKDAFGLPAFFESDRIHAAALIVDDLTEDYSHWNAASSLSAWMAEQGVPGIAGIDTRALTQKLRVSGSMLGKIIMEGDDEAAHAFQDPNKDNLVANVSCKEPKIYNQDGDVTIVAVDVGLKYNQIRCLASRGARVKVVPHDYDFTAEPYDGLFLSNGPGDPAMCDSTIKSLQKVLQNEGDAIKPVFGICLGHQLLSIAIGAKTYKLTFGNRGHNQPCSNNQSGRCYITSQNHGFATDASALPAGWVPIFTNENDSTNEGIAHESLPFFSVQFHPEATAGPEDLELLFDVFLMQCRDKAARAQPLPQTIADFLIEKSYGKPSPPPATLPTKVVVLGSGGLTIGQAGEFDYSGSQAIKALKEEGVQTVLINPNIATVQTMKGLADKVYFLPVTPEYVEQVIAYERPDGLLLAFGGQTALNCGVELYEKGIFEKYSVRVLGTPVQAIVDTEDREIFSQKLSQIDEKCCPNIACTTVDEVVAAAEKIGYPVMMRSSFALGGLGSGVVDNVDDLREKARVALNNTTQVMLERSLHGWKEIEYEVVRDCEDNTITVCNMENFDPLGIHTGESIVIAPSQTLSNDEYNMLRTTAVKVVRHIGIVGECNIQYALNPFSREYYIVEVNARLSRSSALASKATGYPLAYVAAKLALGHTLPKLRNSVTRKTTACFEPSLDYCVVKIPRWDLSKFPTVDKRLGTSMKSVGEVMAIGRIFEEAFQKALRMVDLGFMGFEAGKVEINQEELVHGSEQRPFMLATALKRGYTVDQLYDLTKIDKWFLYRLQRIVMHGDLLKQYDMHSVPAPILREAKQLGFSDAHIGAIVNGNEVGVRTRRQTLNILPVVKQIDTVSAEYPAYTNYLYLTYNGTANDVEFEGDYVMVLGSGVYRIGSSVEFDYCAVGCVRELRRLGFKTIMVNYNPETVSTDYDECDRLYFDQLTFETVMDIYELETARGIVLSMGGQIPNNIANALQRANAKVLGTTPDMIDNAENRYKFSRMCDSIGVDQPEWKELTSVESAKAFAEKVSYPCLMRPSYILSGTAMRVAHSAHDLENDFRTAVVVSRDYPVVLSKFILDAKEIEVDAVASNGELVASCISEHVENAGVHSGDATIVHPPVDLTQKTMNGCLAIAGKIAKALHITGPFNIQFIAKDDNLKVIETNVRASRSFPFVSKTANVDMIAIATRVMLGLDPEVPPQVKPDRVGVKVPQFSFNRLAGADPTLGVDMISTGEVACFGKTREEAYLKAMISTSFRLPRPQGNVLLSIGGYDGKLEFLDSTRRLQQLGFKLFGSMGTADFYLSHGVEIKPVDWLADTEDIESIKDNLLDGHYDMVINLPMRNKYRRPASYMTSGSLARRMAVESKVPLITNIKCAKLFIAALGSENLNPSCSLVDCQSSLTFELLHNVTDAFVRAKEATIAEVKTLTASAAASGFTGICLALPPKHTLTNGAEYLDFVTRASAVAACDVGFLMPAGDRTIIEALGNLPLGYYLDLEGADSQLTPAAVAATVAMLQAGRPLVLRASGHALSSTLLLASQFHVRVIVVEVSTPADLELIAMVRNQGVDVLCSASVLNLFPTTNQTIPWTQQDSDREGLWSLLDEVDFFTAGHGVVTNGLRLDTMGSTLPLLLGAVHDGRLTIEQLAKKLGDNVNAAFAILEQVSCQVEVVADDLWNAPEGVSNPFTGTKSHGRVSRCILRDHVVSIDGRLVTDKPQGEVMEVRQIVPPRSRQVTEQFATPPTSAVEPLVLAQPPARAATSSPTRLHKAAAPLSRGKSSSSLERAAVVAVPEPALPVARIDALAPPSILKGRNILSVEQFGKRELHALFNRAHEFHSTKGASKLLDGKVMANIFYEPSTRTMCSFASAMQRLGGTVITLSDMKSTSVSKGESLSDTVRTMECYTDVIVLRHPAKGAMREASELLRRPLINAGDGVGEHPTQALLDVFTIREELGTVNGLHIAMVGDLKNGRTVHSLARLLSRYNVTLHYISPPSLAMPDDVVEFVKASGITQHTHASIEEIVADIDVLYVTRVQKERFEDEAEYERVKNELVVTPETLINAKKRMIVMHPLPRVNEISPDVDTDPRAAYFRQMEYGVSVRMALLASVLGL